MAYIKSQENDDLVYVPDSDLNLTPENTEYRPKSNKYAKNVYTADSLGVRDSLNALGYNDADIGWDGKNVTYKGEYLLTPEVFDAENGKTTATAGNFITSVNNNLAAQGTGDELVDVTAYAAEASQLPYAVTHDNGIVSLGGVPIKNTIIIDGVAYARKSSIDSIVDSMTEQPGVYSEKANEYLASTAPTVDSYMERIENYGPFTYDPESDPAYIAYRDAYTRNAQKALDQTYAQNAARTGGYANSAAITASNQAYYNHMAELADRIPQLMDNAYDRYLSDFDMLLDGLDLYGTPYDRHLLESDALKLDMDAASKALEADYKRDTDTKEFNYDTMLDERDLEEMLWERDNILYPESLLLWGDVENLPLERELLKLKLYK